MQTPTLDPLISAELVYDYSGPVRIPAKLMPRDPNDEKMKAVFATQFIGTEGERLMELAGRACYDSAGSGRGSCDFHPNLIKINHGSVWAHLNFTVEITFMHQEVVDPRSVSYLLACLNRPGIHVRCDAKTGAVRVTANVRAIREWLDYECATPGSPTHSVCAVNLGWHLNHHLSDIAPTYALPVSVFYAAWDRIEKATGISTARYFDADQAESRIVLPVTDEEKWISLLVTGSRGLSHELVRHGYATGISQRSTRYVDEDTSPWVEHPLTTQFLAEADVVHRAPNGEATELSLRARTQHVWGEATRTYAAIVPKLEAWLVGKGVDKFTARKQARGAARGYLGNALYTELIFSARVGQWKRILRQRGTTHADAEIACLAARVLPELHKSQYDDSFKHFSLQPNPIGFGEIVVEAKHEEELRA